MHSPTSCPVCDATSIAVEREYRFSRPENLDPIARPADRERLVKDIALERRWLLFHEVLGPAAGDSVEVKVMACADCGFRFLSPRLTAQELQVKYAALDRLGFVKSRYVAPREDALTARAQRIKRLVDEVAPLRSGGVVADVGGAWGYNLAPYESGAVIDYERWPTERYPKGTRWIAETMDDLQPMPQFDRVLYAHTLEHVSEPVASLTSISQRLNEGGAVYVEVPLGVWHETAHLQDPITHLNFFGEESLARLMTRCGLRVVHLSTRHQQITHDAQWCVNAVGVKDRGASSVRPKPTWLQRRHPWYYARAAAYKVARRLGAGR